jgi:hypothetical protein
LCAGIELNRIAGAAVCVFVALYVLEPADAAGGCTSVARITAADRIAIDFRASHAGGLAIREASRTAAVAVFTAQFAGRMTTTRGLTHEDSCGAKWVTGAAAALAAAYRRGFSVR